MDWAKLDKHAETVPGNPDAARLAERTESVWTVGVPEKITDKVTLVRKMTDRGSIR